VPLASPFACGEPSPPTLAQLRHLGDNAAIGVLDLEPMAEHALDAGESFQSALAVLQLDRGRDGDVAVSVCARAGFDAGNQQHLIFGQIVRRRDLTLPSS
jgi:hypothetical protein